MALKPEDRIAEVQGQPGTTVRIMQKSRRNSRVVPVDLITGQDTGDSYLIASDHLLNVRRHQATMQTRITIGIPGSLHERLGELANPFETPADVIARHLPPKH